MIAYDRARLDARQTTEQAGQWHRKGLISDNAWQKIKAECSDGFYSPNVFVRIGLALFCMILLLAIAGFLATVVRFDGDDGYAGLLLLLGATWIFVLETLVIRNKKHFGSGLDDMMLYGAAVAILSAIFILFDITSLLATCLVILPFLVAGSVRYLDRLMAAGAFVFSLWAVLLLVKDMPRVALYALPFAGMLFSAGAYTLARAGGRRVHLRYWHGVLAVVEMLSLLTFYASGNYWVVQQTAADLFALEVPPLGWFFWLFTFAVPALYIYRGLVRKDRLLLDTGIGCVAAAVFTFRYYFHVLPLAWAAAGCGALLFATAWFSIRYLRKNTVTYTYEPETAKSLLQKVQEQVFDQTIAGQAASVPAKKTSMDGGQFGGGGAGGDF